MPADLYKTKPVDTIWNFGELLNHIAYAIERWANNYIRMIETEWKPPFVSTDKKAVIKYFENSYYILQKTMDSVTFTKVNSKGFHATMDHITHHRGQAVIHLTVMGLLRRSMFIKNYLSEAVFNVTTGSFQPYLF